METSEKTDRDEPAHFLVHGLHDESNYHPFLYAALQDALACPVGVPERPA
jgi:hypothetical protein